MPTELAPARLDYAAQTTERCSGNVFSRHLSAIVVWVFLLVTLWIGTYFYFRVRHSLNGVYASAPISWKKIHYDEHYPWGRPLFYLHQPLVWLDCRLTGTDVQIWANDFHGNRDNYGLEAFN